MCFEVKIHVVCSCWDFACAPITKVKRTHRLHYKCLLSGHSRLILRIIIYAVVGIIPNYNSIITYKKVRLRNEVRFKNKLFTQQKDINSINDPASTS